MPILLNRVLALNSSDKKIHFDLRGYTTLVSRHIVRSDYIVFADQSTPDENTILYKGEEVKTQANKNLGNRFIYGGSIQMNYELNKKITAMGSVTYTDSYKDLNLWPNAIDKSNLWRSIVGIRPKEALC